MDSILILAFRQDLQDLQDFHIFFLLATVDSAKRIRFHHFLPESDEHKKIQKILLILSYIKIRKGSIPL
jgi:hypothetical protein